MGTDMHEQINVGQIGVRFLLEGEGSGGAVAMFEFDVPAGARVPIAHSHDGYEETIYGLAGTLSWTVAGEASEVGPGEVLCIPRGVVHHFANGYVTDATALAIVTRECSARDTSATWRRSSWPRPAARQIRPRWSR